MKKRGDRAPSEDALMSRPGWGWNSLDTGHEPLDPQRERPGATARRAPTRRRRPPRNLGGRTSDPGKLVFDHPELLGGGRHAPRRPISVLGPVWTLDRSAGARSPGRPRRRRAPPILRSQSAAPSRNQSARSERSQSAAPTRKPVRPPAAAERTRAWEKGGKLCSGISAPRGRTAGELSQSALRHEQANRRALSEANSPAASEANRQRRANPGVRSGSPRCVSVRDGAGISDLELPAT